MKPLHFAIFIVIIVSVNGKISGGPRGRFDDKNHRKASHHVTAHHAHYSYHPPSEIHFMCRRCSNFAPYPVYHGVLPTYIYKYRESNGKFGYLLSGLALYNLGRASAEHWDYTHFYSINKNENCSLQVMDQKHFEETAFPCFMMSSFMDRSPESLIPNPEALDITSPQIDVRPYISHTGSALQVTRDQECIIWHNATISREKNAIPCALLKEYAETMKPSGIPVYVWLPITIGTVITIYILCQCCCKSKSRKDESLKPSVIRFYSHYYY
ncbi:unnamed protein product [Pieris brassicae]|uniref:Uncharacterized protein n=1 Tax=Pieris brassicae TaxID=7116 RepID=A0A9P0TRR1_PIEBR|nr:unnamed protein product [Pieris brassicae]